MASGDLPDITIELVSADRHVNLQCSPAFFNAVAKPAVATLSEGYSEQIGDLLVQMPKPPLEQRDETNLSVTHCYQLCIYDKTAT